MNAKAVKQLAELLQGTEWRVKDIYFQGDMGAPAGNGLNAERYAVEIQTSKTGRSVWYLYYVSDPDAGWQKAQTRSRNGE